MRSEGPDADIFCYLIAGDSYGASAKHVWPQWSRWALHSVCPSRGLETLRKCGRINIYPEVNALIGVPQDPVWHPEGDVWEHTLLVCDAAAAIARRDKLIDGERLVLMFGALCHDLGKPGTTKLIEGRWKAHGHCDAGVPLARSFLQSIGCPEEIVERVEPLVAEHLVHALVKRDATPRMLRRLIERLGETSLEQLFRLIEADMNGRPPMLGGLPEGARILQQVARQSRVASSAPKPIVLGRHLIALGYSPNAWFGQILKRCYEAQLDGEFDNEDAGVRYLQQLISNRP